MMRLFGGILALALVGSASAVPPEGLTGGAAALRDHWKTRSGQAPAGQAAAPRRVPGWRGAWGLAGMEIALPPDWGYSGAGLNAPFRGRSPDGLCAVSVVAAAQYPPDTDVELLFRGSVDKLCAASYSVLYTESLRDKSFVPLPEGEGSRAGYSRFYFVEMRQNGVDIRGVLACLVVSDTPLFMVAEAVWFAAPEKRFDAVAAAVFLPVWQSYRSMVKRSSLTRD